MSALRIIVSFLFITLSFNSVAQIDPNSAISTCTGIDEVCQITDGNILITNNDFEKHIDEFTFNGIDHFGAEEFHMAWGSSFPDFGKGDFDGDIEIYETLDLDLATQDASANEIVIDWSDDWVDVHIVQEIVSSSETTAHIRETISFTRTDDNCGRPPQDASITSPNGTQSLCDFWFTEYTRWDLGGSSEGDSAEWDGSKFIVTDGDWTATVTPSVMPDHIDVAIDDDDVEEALLVTRLTTGHLAGSAGPVGPAPDGDTETGHAAEYNLRLDFSTQTISFDKVITFTPEVEANATFTMTKEFTDGDNPTEVAVTLDCFSGLPITQTQSISETQELTLTVHSFVPGALNCTVTEATGGEELLGYTPSYYAGGPGTSNNEGACNFFDLEPGAYTCHIENNADPVDVTLEKLWIIDGESGDAVNTNFTLTLFCDADIEGGSDVCTIGNKPGDSGAPIPFYESCREFSGNSSETFIAEVTPKWPDSHCWVFETIYDSAVDPDNDCQNLTVSHGQGDSCLVTNSVFFEGIPSLNKFGLAVMVLLMFGMGVIGSRRFV